MDMPGFDNDTYLHLQSEQILKRINTFGGKLYLEFGGKLFDDYHASRVLPGFAPDSKVMLLKTMADKAEIIVVIGAGDIEKNRMRGDLGITYDADLLRLIDAFRAIGLYVGSVVITQYAGQSAANLFKSKLEHLGIRVYLHYTIEGYPSNVPFIVSDEGFGKNEFVETTRPLVVVTAPGPASGKMATCLSQLYHEYKRGVCAGYAKFETFPIWNLPLKHPTNLAYEAATADLHDVNMIDPYHLEAYEKIAINYNRDIEVFPVLNAIFEKIAGVSPYKSPTDMGVNMAGFCINDDEKVRLASKKEIVRRYYKTMCDYRINGVDQSSVTKVESIMHQAGAAPEMRPVIEAAIAKAEETGDPAAAIELADGRVVTGKTSELLGAASAALINALKLLGGINEKMHLISPNIIEPIQKMKVGYLGNKNPRLHTDEVLIALAISATTNPTADLAIKQLGKLRDCEAHSTVILAQVDDGVFHHLGVNITCEPNYQTKKLFHK